MATSGYIFVVDCQPAQAYTFQQSDQENILVLSPNPTTPLAPLEGEIMAVNPQPPQCYTFTQFEQEGIIGLSRDSLPRMDESLEAESIYYAIMDECEKAGVSLPPHNTWPVFANADVEKWLAEEKQIHQARVMASPWNGGYDQTFSCPEAHSSGGNQGLHKFFRCLYEYCPEAGRANVIRLVLFALFFEFDSKTIDPRPMSQILSLARVWSRYTTNDKHKGYRILQEFAKDILTGFFLPFRMKRERTQIPLHRTSATPYPKFGLEQNSLERRRGLATLCFERDGARCVITGKYHRDWALGKTQQWSIYGMTETDVAYIIPQALNNMERDGNVVCPPSPLSSLICSSESNTTQSKTSNFIWHIINMLDIGLSAQLEAHKIDTPMNAMLMDKSLCESFGKLQWYLEEVPVSTYSPRISSLHC